MNLVGNISGRTFVAVYSKKNGLWTQEMDWVGDGAAI